MYIAALSFSLFMLSFLIIGLSAARMREPSVADYLLGGRTIKPWLTALSAASTNCSGFMFIGLIGLSYKLGFYAFWFVIGIILGSLIVWYLWVPALRQRAGMLKALTYLDVILPRERRSPHEPGADAKVQLDRWVAGGITLVFLSVYAAAQLKAGTKAMHSMFDWPPELGIWMSALLILIYCLSGGYRATVWSDAAQSIVMFAAMLLLASTSIYEVGGWAGLIDILNQQSPKLTQLFRDQQSIWISLGSGLAWTFVGVGSLGQPHIMIRPIALPTVGDVPATRRVFFSYYIVFVVLSVFVGICARAIMPMTEAGFDPELALPTLASAQLPSALLGLVLAGVFASAVSTADSQVLSCSAVIAGDLRASSQRSYKAQKFATIAVLVIVALIATWAPADVFTLVILAWSALAAPFVPLAVAACHGIPLRVSARLAIMICGVSVFIMCRIWGTPWGLHELFVCWGMSSMVILVDRILLVRQNYL